jgi:hypothetical protein
MHYTGYAQHISHIIQSEFSDLLTRIQGRFGRSHFQELHCLGDSLYSSTYLHMTGKDFPIPSSVLSLHLINSKELNSDSEAASQVATQEFPKEPEGSLPFSHPITGPYHEPD